VRPRPSLAGATSTVQQPGRPASPAAMTEPLGRAERALRPSSGWHPPPPTRPTHSARAPRGLCRWGVRRGRPDPARAAEHPRYVRRPVRGRATGAYLVSRPSSPPRCSCSSRSRSGCPLPALPRVRRGPGADLHRSGPLRPAHRALPARWACAGTRGYVRTPSSSASSRTCSRMSSSLWSATTRTAIGPSPPL
jgi:hypothetical protein